MIEYEAVPIRKGSSRGIYVSGKNIDEARAKLIRIALADKGDVVAYNLYGHVYQTPYHGTLIVSKTKGAFWKGAWNYEPVQATPFSRVNARTGKLSSKTVMPEFSKYLGRY